jgi:multidrug resistance efflux pump
VTVGRCVKVTETKDRLSGSDLVTVLGGAAVAHLMPRLAQPGPALRIVPAEVSLPGLPAQAQRLSRIESSLPPVPAQQSRSQPSAPPQFARESVARSPSHAGVPASIARPPSHGAERHSLPSARTSTRSRPADEATPIGGVVAPMPPSDQHSPVAGAPGPVAEHAAQPAGERPAAPAVPPRAEQPERTAMPPAPPAAPGRDLFRKAAVEAHAIGPRITDTENPKHGAWGMLVLLLSLVAAIFVGAALLSVEVTVRAPGALRAPNGLRSVESVISGAVTQVLVRAGDEVVANQVVARLEEAQLRATLTLRERELETLTRDTDAAAEADSSLFTQTTEAVLHQRAALGRRSSIHQTQMRQRSAQLDNVRELRRHGVATGNDELSGEEQVQAAAESIAMVGSQMAELSLALADRQREWKQRELDRRAALARANAAVDEARSLLAMAEVRAPAAGRVESLLVQPGAVVQPSQVLAQIVPSDAPRLIVAFLPSREMSFVSVGSEANVEVESLPVNEFGMARAQVSRISSDVAKPEEIEKAFGEVLPGSYVRVELALLDGGGQEKMAPHLRSGERVLVRLHRRQQRVLSMIFEFTRKWLDS